MPAYTSPYVPVYGAPYSGSAEHRGAKTSMILGIAALASLALAFVCCLTLPGVFLAPFAWGIGAKAKREIDAQPGVFGNRSSAQAGVVMGIIGTLLGFVMIAGFVALAVWLGTVDYSQV